MSNNRKTSTRGKVIQMKAKPEPMTPKKLRTYPGLEALSEEEAAQIIASLRKLSILLFHAVRQAHKNGTIIIDNQSVTSIFTRSKGA